MTTRASVLPIVILLLCAIGLPLLAVFLVPDRYQIITAVGLAVLLWALISLYLYRQLARPLDKKSQPANNPVGNRDAVFEAIFNNTFQFTGLLEPNGKLIEANQTALDFAGITLAEVKGNYFWDTHWWNHDTNAQQRVQAAVKRAASGEFVRYEDIVQDAKSNRVSIDFSLRPVFNDKGQVVMLIPEGRDIQEQANIRAALEESETRFRTMVNSAKIGVTLLNPKGQIIYGNDFIRNLLGGFSQQEFTKVDVADYTHPDDLDISYNRLKQLQAGEVDEYHITKRFITRQNSTIWVSLSVSAVRSQQGELRYVLSLAQDITHQKQIEEALQSSELKYRTLVEQSPFAYVIHQEGKIVFANPKAISLSGLDNEEALLGQDMLAFVADQYKEVAKERMQRMMSTSVAEEPMKQTLINAKGEQYIVEAIPTPIQYDGKPAIQLVLQDITLQEQAKSQIEKSEFILRNAEKIANIGSWEWNVGTTTARWSEVMYEIYEWDKKDGALGPEQLFAMVHPDDLDKVKKSYEGIMEHQPTQQVEFRLVLPSGRIKYLEARNSAIFSEHGQVKSMIGTVQDVTSRKLAEKQLSDSQNQLKNLTDSIPGTVLRYQLLPDGTDNILFISNGVIDVWEVTPDQVLSDTNHLWKYIYPEYIPEMRQSIQQSAATLQQWKHEWLIQTQSGKDRWLLGLGVPTKESDGSTVWDTIILDITQQKIAEQALMQSEQRYKSLFQNNLAGVYQIDLQDNRRIVSCNKAFAQIIGMQEAKDVIGKSVNELFESLKSNNYYDKILEEGRVINWESQLRLKNGQVIQTLENSMVLTEEGEAKYIEGTVFDITKLKSAESERIRLIEQLTFQNKNLEDFAYIVSHNLRSPVAALLGLTSLAESKKDNPELLDQVLDRMRLSAEELDTIIKDLNIILTAKRNSGQEKEWVDLTKLLHSIVNLQKHDIDLVNGKVLFDLDGIDKLYAIKGYLHNIFFNLISNGFKYRSPDRDPVVLVSANRKGNRIQIEVKDNGIGIDLDQFGNKLFSLYQRFHSHVEGRGIGLYLVRSQVENMGGHITVESELGKGTSFYIYFDADKVQPTTVNLVELVDESEK